MDFQKHSRIKTAGDKKGKRARYRGGVGRGAYLSGGRQHVVFEVCDASACGIPHANALGIEREEAADGRE
jgi:hypothetical protein